MVGTPSTPAARHRTAVLGLASAVAATLSSAALAGTLTVQVSKADGSPAADTVVLVQPVGSWTPPEASAPVVLTQKDLRFEPYVVAVPLGGTLRLTNQDRFDHHVRSMAGGPLGQTPPAKSFEVRLAGQARGPGGSTDLRMDGGTGDITLGCHIHGSMRGHVYVSPTPWVGVSDSRGLVRLEGVPEGTVELKAWHPDQLSDQPTQRLSLGAAQAQELKLNFSPRRRRTPPIDAQAY